MTDPLEAISEPRWLVIRNRSQQVIEYRELWQRSDLRGAVEVERARKAVEGWHVEDVPRNCAFCFAVRGHERLCIGVECLEPGPSLAYG